MSFVSSSLSFTLTFLLGCGLTPMPKPSPSLVVQQVKRSNEEMQGSEAFSRILEMRRVKRTSSAISITPKMAKIRPRNLYLANGKTSVLSIPIDIANSSSHSISLNLAHEWYGGIWPPTDLYVAKQLRGVKGTFWADAPGYLVGEKDSMGSKIVLKPRETKSFDIRLNWPGTGSVPTMPLIDESRADTYSIKFLLLFKANNSEEYVETQEFDVEVER